MRPVEMKDILNYRFLSGIRYSPDGKRAAFVAANANEEENSYEHRLWLYENGEVRQLTDLGKEGSFVWLDDSRLLFSAVRSPKEKKKAEAKESFTSDYILDLHGGEALPAFTLPFAVRGIRVLDETHFAVTASVDRENPDLYGANEETRAAVRKEREENRDYEVFEELPFCMNGAGYTNGRRSRLFLVSLDPLDVKPVTELPEEPIGMTVMGDTVYFAVRERLKKREVRGFILRSVNWITGETREILRNQDLMFDGLEASEEKLWLFGGEGKRFGLNENPWVYSVDPENGTFSLIREEEYSMYGSVGSDCRLGGGQQMKAAGKALFSQFS